MQIQQGSKFTQYMKRKWKLICLTGLQIRIQPHTMGKKGYVLAKTDGVPYKNKMHNSTINCEQRL